MSEYVTCNGGCDNSDYDDKHNKTCNTAGFQKINVCVPVTVTPFAKAGKTKTKCCGDAVVTCGNNNCPGRKNGSCTFTITQKICVEVPVEFGAKAMVGDTFVDCLKASAEDICENCDDDKHCKYCQTEDM